jgi:long-chain-fatty-acid---luciferin-component ligase
VTPDLVNAPEHLTRIPLIPSSMFKSLDIRSVPEESITKVCYSSGTRGSVSRIPRDNTSLERFVGSIRISADQLLNLRAESRVFNLGPDSNEASEVWFPYVMSLLGLLRPAENYVIMGVFYPLSLVEDLSTLPETTQPFLVGPPILLRRLLQFLQEEGITLDLGARGGFVVTAGGWKSFSDEQIDRDEFTTLCMTLLGVRDRGHIRDAYNMVELNTVLFECELGIKHIPPWLMIESLDPETLVPRRSNEIGLLAFYDPLPTSYPGFILSDDFGKVNKETCACGRSGPTFEFCRRVALVEGRGCALTMGRNTRTNKDVLISRSTHARL